MTPDPLFSIASNSKLFLSISVGLLLSNQTLAQSFQNRTGNRLEWWTKMKDLIPEEWVIEDKDIERERPSRIFSRIEQVCLATTRVELARESINAML
jgi:hypothetical protein